MKLTLAKIQAHKMGIESLLLLFMLFIIVAFIFSFCCKVSALLLRRTVSWKDCVQFSCVLIVCNLLLIPVSGAVNRIFTKIGLHIPAFPGLIALVIVQLMLGAEFFSHRAAYLNGQHAGLRGGAGITALALSFFSGIAALLWKPALTALWIWIMARGF